MENTSAILSSAQARAAAKLLVDSEMGRWGSSISASIAAPWLKQCGTKSRPVRDKLPDAPAMRVNNSVKAWQFCSFVLQNAICILLH
jgi:hypothetical protein